jgi:hypothetical protein
MSKLQTMLSEDCFREGYQKRLIQSGGSEEAVEPGAGIEAKIQTSARNLMNLGVYISAAVGPLVALGFHALYGDKHPQFGAGLALFTLGSVFKSYALRLNVDPQLDFNFTIMVFAEALGFSFNTMLQAYLIRWRAVDPILAFGLANAASGAVQALAFLAYFWATGKYSSSLGLVPISRVGEPRKYLLPNTLRFSVSLAYNSLLNEFFDQTYFVIFASADSYLGELTLIRGFGSLFVRFLFMPINNVAYNLYSKLYLESLRETERARKCDLLHKLMLILKTILTLLTSISLFFLVYGWRTSDFVLGALFGKNWVNPVLLAYQTFVAAFLLYILVVLAIGVASNLEGFAKSVFDQKSLQDYNSLNTKWLVAYFFLLHYLRGHGLLGVFGAFLAFYSMRSAIAIRTASRIDPYFDWKKMAGAIVPGLLDTALYLSALVFTHVAMSAFEARPHIGFAACVVCALAHFGCFLYLKKELLLEFRRLLSKTSN